MLIKIYAVFNPKAKAWINGRKNWLPKLKNATQNFDNCIWFHCASLGEFEQGRPLIELIKNKHPKEKIVLSFFSPSGYSIRKNYKLADYVCYLPADTPGNANAFIKTIQPKLVVFVKYEWWYFFSKEIYKAGIPFYNISSIFLERHIFFKPYGLLHRKILSYHTKIFVQDESSKKLLKTIKVNHVAVSGDTRFDTVYQNKLDKIEVPFIKDFKGSNHILIGGSTYKQEDEILLELINSSALSNFKYIIVPHEIDVDYCKTLQQKIKGVSKLYSTLNNNSNLNEIQVIIIDSIGWLSHLYQYSTFAIIGGGYGKGIHNILEAAVYNVIVFFGPNYKNANEAIELVNLKLAFELNSSQQIIKNIEGLEANTDLQTKNKTALEEYFKNSIGATGLIYKLLAKHL